MYRTEIPRRQLLAWVFVAMTAPVLQMSSGSGWQWVAAFGFLGLALTGWGMSLEYECKSWLRRIRLLWMVLVMALMLERSADSWPMGDAYPIVPLVVLALAAWSASKGVESASAAASTLLYIVVGAFAAIMAAGVQQVGWTEIKEIRSMPDASIWLLYLIPLASRGIQREQKPWGMLLGVWILAVASAVVTQGVLGVTVMASDQTAFYTMSRCLELLGTWERFEAVVCGLETVGWFALFSLLLSASAGQTGTVDRRKEKAAVWTIVGVVAALVLCKMRTNVAFLGILGVICWGLLPFLAQGIEKRKKV